MCHPSPLHHSPRCSPAKQGKLLARLRQRIKTTFKRVIMGYDAEEEKAQLEYAQRLASFAHIRGLAEEEALTTAAALVSVACVVFCMQFCS
jgi:hypothetical protein